MKRHLQCAEQQVSRSNLTKYCACHAERLTYLVLITYETSFTVRGAAGVTIQPHQILRLSRRKTHILSPHHIWNVIYSARSNRCHNPTSPNTAPATQNCIAKFLTKSLKTGETSFPMRGRSEHDPSMIRAWSEHDSTMIRPWSDHDPTMKPSVRNPPRNRGYFSSPPRAFSIVKYNVLRPILHSNFHQVLRLPRKVILELHQIMHLPRKVTLEPHQVLHLSRKVTLEPHQVLRLLRKVTLELHQILRLPRKVTLELHQILRLPRKMTLQDFRKNLQKQVKRHFQCGDDPSMIRAWSDHENENRNPPRKWGYFSSSPGAFSIVKYNVSSPILHSNIHQVLHLSRKVTLELHQILRLPRKVTLELHQVLRLPRKVTLELHQVLHLPRKVTLELHQILRLPRKVTLELHQVLRLPRKVTLELHLLDSTLLDSTLLYSTELYWTLPYSTVLNCNFIELWTVTLLNCDFTELWLYWTVNCDSTELWLYWTVTLLNCDFTELWLYWTVTLLNCDFTELWLYFTVTLLNCDFTELWLYWTVTLLNCDFTLLWLYWTVTLLNCDFTLLTLLHCYFTSLNCTLLRCHSYIGSFST